MISTDHAHGPDDHDHEAGGHDESDHPHDRPRPHGRDHAEGGDHRHPGGLRGALHEIFRPHSHDAAESIDTALEASERGVRAVKISFAGLVVTAVIQLVVVVLTGSVALLADTIHNFSDALTAIPLFIAFRLGRRPPNRRFTYGYRRAEDLAGVFVIAMITLSAVVAAWVAIDRLLHPRTLDNVGVLLAAGLVGFIGNEAVALYRIREGNAIGSAALVADGYHARTDGFTSLAVALGAIGVWAGFDRADPIVGLVISIAIFAVLRGAARQIYYRLMDAVDPAIVDRVAQVAAAAHGVLSAGPIRVRWQGHRLSADVTIVVAGGLSVSDGHVTAEVVRHDLLHQIVHLDEVLVHVDPEDDDAHRRTDDHHPVI